MQCYCAEIAELEEDKKTLNDILDKLDAALTEDAEMSENMDNAKTTSEMAYTSNSIGAVQGGIDDLHKDVTDNLNRVRISAIETHRGVERTLIEYRRIDAEYHESENAENQDDSSGR